MYRMLRFLLSIGLINRPTFGLRISFKTESSPPFSLAWSFAELGPPVVNVSAAAYVCVAWQQ